MVFNATFNIFQLYRGGQFNRWRNENQHTRRTPPICRKLYHIMLYRVQLSPGTGFELTILVVIGTDCTCSCKSNYHSIMTTMGPVTSQCWIYIEYYTFGFNVKWLIWNDIWRIIFHFMFSIFSELEEEEPTVVSVSIYISELYDVNVDEMVWKTILT